MKVSLGPVQLSMMRIIWNLGEASVAEVHQALLKQRDIAPTTTATMLTKLEKRGILSHRLEGRRFIYSANVSEDQVSRTMVGELMHHLFGGNVTKMVSHLITEHEVSESELARLQKLLQQANNEPSISEDQNK